MKPMHYTLLAIAALAVWLLYRNRQAASQAKPTDGPPLNLQQRLICPQDWVAVNGVCRYRYAQWWNQKTPI